MSFDTGRLSPVSAASAVCSAVDSDQARIGRNGVALFDEDDVAGDELRRRNAPPLAVADHVGVRGRHLAQRRHRLLGARLLNVAHDRVEQHDGEDRDRLVGQRRFALIQPQRCGDRSGDEQQDHEHIGELGEELPPCRDGFSAVSSFLPITSKPVLGPELAQASSLIRAECG